MERLLARIGYDEGGWLPTVTPVAHLAGMLGGGRRGAAELAVTVGAGVVRPCRRAAGGATLDP